MSDCSSNAVATLTPNGIMVVDAITIAPTERLQRTLRVSFNPAGYVTVSVYVDPRGAVPGAAVIAWAHAPLSECKVDLYDETKSLPPALWVGNTAYEVLPAEAEELQRTFRIAANPV